LSERPGSIVTIADLRAHPVAASLDPNDLGGLVAFGGALLENDGGEVVRVIGAFDTVSRSWTSGDRNLIHGLASLALGGAGSPGATSGHDLPGLTRHVAESLTTASEGVAGLVSYAEAQEDPVLQRHAGAAERHLRVLRGHATRLRSVLSSGGVPAPAATLFDVGVVIQSAVREAAAALGVTEPACTVSGGPLSVSGNPVAAKRSLVQLLEGVLLAAPPQTVSVHVHSQSFASDRLDGTLAVELRLRVHGIGLTVAELSRAVAGVLGPAPGVVGGPINLQVLGDEVHLEGPGLRAHSAPNGSSVAVRWPVDLG
ncbi:MAG TPA: hypothetical protein VFT81_06135, partial [Dermatophilaceae bacterium]|nr:hypothetical protein [Dermatophilaceae bacterium]